MRSDGLLAHAQVDVRGEALERFALAIDALLRSRVGQATLVGEVAPASALVIDASDAETLPRLTILACPPQPFHGRVVVESLELSRTDLANFRQWAAYCSTSAA